MINKINFRNSRPDVFYKKGVLENFSGLKNLLKKRLWHRCFPVNFVKFLRTPFFIEHLRTTASVITIFDIILEWYYHWYVPVTNNNLHQMEIKCYNMF